MTITQQQRQHTEQRIRAAMDRLLRGEIPTDGGCDVKTLAREAGVSRASLYRTYQHLKTEFEQRLQRIRDAGQLPDPRAAQMLRLTEETTHLRQRLAETNRQVEHLTALKTTAISRLAAQHHDVLGLRAALAGLGNVHPIHPRPAASQDDVLTPVPAARPASTPEPTTVDPHILRSSADLLALLHTFLAAASREVLDQFGQFVATQHEDLGEPAIAAAVLTHEISDAVELLRALTTTSSCTGHEPLEPPTDLQQRQKGTRR
jgi:AcrR family transcriptional regulator